MGIFLNTSDWRNPKIEITTNKTKTTKKMEKLENLHLMSTAELNELIKQCKQMIDLKGGLARNFRIGDEVIVDHPRLSGMVGEIIKINTKKCKVDFNGEIYNVPMSMIEVE